MTYQDILNRAKGPTGKAAGMFCLGAAALLLSAFAIVRNDLADGARRAAAVLSAEAKTLSAEARALAVAAKTAEGAPPLTSVPAFIDRIGALAEKHRTPVRAIQPSKRHVDRFEIVLEADYRPLVGFVAALEELDVQIISFDVARSDIADGEADLTAKVVILPRNDARRLKIPRMDAVRAALESIGARNPFLAVVEADGGAGDGRQDISAAYRLTGVAEVLPSGDRIATIDLFDYVIGDMLDGREIVHVGDDRVFLNGVGDRQEDRYVIRMIVPE